MIATTPLPNFFSRHRIAVIAASVLAFHALAIWALQSGLLMRAVEIMVPVEILAQIIEPPKPVVVPPPPPPPVVPKEIPPPPKLEVVKPASEPKPSQPVQQTQAPPQILAVETATPAPNAPSPVQAAPPAPIMPPSVPVAAVASPAAPAAPPTPPVPAPVSAKVVLPTSDGDYLSNPKPPFPAMSKRLGEQGSVKLRIFVSADGLPKKAELQQSSGFERLDKAAIAAAMQWRYIPGKRGDIAEDMWMGTTISFVLD